MEKKAMISILEDIINTTQKMENEMEEMKNKTICITVLLYVLIEDFEKDGTQD